MIRLDFFLYDNQTWSPRWGRDWGLKAATGALADRSDLREIFDCYCGFLPGSQGQLRGFGEAIGGVRSQQRDGYLFCITLECSDSFGRPSWAVFGLWCPDSSLEQVLSAGDPISAVRAVLGSAKPPDAIEIRPPKAAAGPRRKQRASTEPVFYRFDSGSTVREVVSLLLGAIQRRGPLPNVLGITATSRLADVVKAGFNVAYCHPLDDQAERALARVLSPQEPEVEEPFGAPLPPVERPPRLPERPAPVQFVPPEPSRQSTFFPWLFSLALIVVLGGIGFLLLMDRRDPPISKKTSHTAEAGDPPTPPRESPAPRMSSDQSALKELRLRLEDCKKLTPEEILHSPGYNAAENIEVLPDYQENRDRVRQAYSHLLDLQNRMVRQQGTSVAYYYDEASKEVEPATRLQKILEILEGAPFSNQDCAVLKDAFGFEFENETSVVNRWCKSLEALERTRTAIKRSSGS